MGQVYCTVAELLDDLEVEGVRNVKIERIYDKLKAASRWIENNIGNFIPKLETRYFDGSGDTEIIIDPLLEATAITVDDETLTLTDALFYPLNALWAYGPYMRVKIDPDSTSLYYFPKIAKTVAIAGSWGMFERSAVTGATVASQTNVATTLVVDNGSGISPGEVLLIEDEQQLVTGIGSPTDSTANSAEALDLDEDELTVTDGTKVNVGEIIRVDFEQMLVLDISGNDLLVQRGWNRTNRVTHLTGLDVYVYRTFNVERGVNGTTAAAHDAEAVGRYLVPDDIHWLCKQMAALMLKKADSSFAGKVGDAATGEVFYFNEFPKGTIDAIKERYFLPFV